MLGFFTKETEDVILFYFKKKKKKRIGKIPYRSSTFPSGNILNNNYAKIILNDQERQIGADK